MKFWRGPKGRACRLDLTAHYRLGRAHATLGKDYNNVWDFFNAYEKHYAYDIGYQAGKNAKNASANVGQDSRAV